MTQYPNPLVLGLDLEGINRDLIYEGVDVNTDRVMEIGAVLWDWTKKQPVSILSEIIDEVDRLPINEELTELTGLDEEILKHWAFRGEDIAIILKKLALLMNKADYIMAHNGIGYDRPMLKALFERHGVEYPDAIWLDTLTDVEFPKRITGRSLALLEHAHGFINPFPHRAVTDVLSMLKIASNYSLTRMSKLATSPTVKIVAELSAPNWRNKEEVDVFNRTKNKVAKARFKWNPGNKTWVKEMPKILVDEGLQFDFGWYILES